MPTGGADSIQMKASLLSCELQIPSIADTEFIPDNSSVLESEIESLEMEIAEDAEVAKADEPKNRRTRA